MLAAFLASLVEFVEALTVVLAIGTVRGWGGALFGTGVAILTLALLVAVLGPALAAVPLGAIQFVVGLMLLLFGMRWLRKAILRAAGAIPYHDEAAVYASETKRLRDGENPRDAWDKIAIATSFKITMIEGIEVVFIVIATGVGGPGMLRAASLGAAAAFLCVVLLGIALRRPIASIPENALKFGVGILLTAFGTFWVGEGMGARWPGGDWSLLVLVACFLTAAVVSISLCILREGWPPQYRNGDR
jgi:uncharacterized membrane protein